MLKFFRRQKSDSNGESSIGIVFERPDGVFGPGQTVAFVVTIEPAEDLKVRSAEMSMTGTESYCRIESRRETDADGETWTEEVEVSETHNLFDKREKFLTKRVLAAGEPYRQEFQVQIPGTALPSVAAGCFSVQWQIRVDLDVPRKGDLHTSREFTVRSGPVNVPRDPAEYGVSEESSFAHLTLVLPSTQFVAGEPVTGELHIKPLSAFTGRPPRVELVCNLAATVRDGVSSRIAYPCSLMKSEIHDAEKIEFLEGELTILSFEVRAPSDCVPTIRTPNGSCSWQIDGILDLPNRADEHVLQEITIHARGGP